MVITLLIAVGKAGTSVTQSLLAELFCIFPWVMKTCWQGKGKENEREAAPWCGSEFLRHYPKEKAQRGAADSAAADKGFDNPLPNGSDHRL